MGSVLQLRNSHDILDRFRASQSTTRKKLAHLDRHDIGRALTDRKFLAGVAGVAAAFVLWRVLTLRAR